MRVQRHLPMSSARKGPTQRDVTSLPVLLQIAMHAQTREREQRQEEAHTQSQCQDYSRMRMYVRETRAVRMTFVSLLLAVVLISVLHTRFLSALYSIHDPVASNAVKQSSMPREAVPRVVGHSTATDFNLETKTIASVEAPLRVVRPRLCTIYDAPPGTGELAVSSALATCLLSTKHRVRAPFVREASTALRALVILNSSLVASIGQSFITAADSVLLKTRCRHIIYVTSTATMRARLRDAAHVATNESTDAATDWLVRRGRDAMRFYNAFPCVRMNSQFDYPNDEIIPDRFATEENADGPVLRPDFIIQRETLEEDLGPLLHAFGCESKELISADYSLIHAETRSEKSMFQADEGRNSSSFSGNHGIPSEVAVHEKVLSEILATESSEKSHHRLVAMSRRVNQRGLARITHLMNAIRKELDDSSTVL